MTVTGRVSSSAALVLGIAVAVPGTLAAQRGAAPAPEQVTVVACVAREPAPAQVAAAADFEPENIMKNPFSTGRARAGSGVVVFASLLFAAGTVYAGDVAPGLETESCLRCHEDAVFESPAHPDTQCAECHSRRCG